MSPTSAFRACLRSRFSAAERRSRSWALGPRPLSQTRRYAPGRPPKRRIPVLFEMVYWRELGARPDQNRLKSPLTARRPDTEDSNSNSSALHVELRVLN